MDKPRPLQNPSVKDFKPPKSQIEPQEVDYQAPLPSKRIFDISSLQVVTKKQQPKQLSLGLDSTSEKLKRRFGSLKSNIKYREQLVELTPFWNDFTPAIAIVSGTLLVLGSGVVGVSQFGKIQPQVPFYFNAFSGYWEQVDKIILIFLPVIMLVANLIIIRFSFEVFKFDHRLSRAINLILSLLNLLFMIALVQIYSLILA